MQGVKTQNKVIALVMAMAMAIACSLALVPAAFAVDWNPYVTVTAMGGNGTYAIGSDHTATITENSTKTENGQYIAVTMQFTSSADLSGVTADTARTYLLANATIAGRSLTASNYNRDIFNVAVDDTAKTITFDIAYNTAGTTANYNGKLNIAAVTNTAIGAAMDNAAVETLIGTGVAISDNNGTLSSDKKTKTFTITADAKNRGMVHVLITDGETGAIFSGTGTFSNGGITVHAHEFITQTVGSFASLISSTANGTTAATTVPYTFTALTDDDGAYTGQFTVTHGTASVKNVRVYIYDCNYLNAKGIAVGDISAEEYDND